MSSIRLKTEKRWQKLICAVKNDFQSAVHLYFLQGASISSYAEPCISYGRDVCLSVRHMLALSQNDLS